MNKQRLAIVIGSIRPNRFGGHAAQWIEEIVRRPYLTGRVFTGREGVYKRAVEDGLGMPAGKDALGTASFHCSPAASIAPDGTYKVGAVTATASFRFAKWLGGFFKISGCNVIIGKGGMTSATYRDFFVPNNAVYLTTVGYGTARFWAAASSALRACIGWKNSGSRRQSGYSTSRTLARSSLRATLTATRCSSARMRRSRPVWTSSTPAPSPRRCAATAKPTTRPKK